MHESDVKLAKRLLDRNPIERDGEVDEDLYGDFASWMADCVAACCYFELSAGLDAGVWAAGFADVVRLSRDSAEMREGGGSDWSASDGGGEQDDIENTGMSSHRVAAGNMGGRVLILEEDDEEVGETGRGDRGNVDDSSGGGNQRKNGGTATPSAQKLDDDKRSTWFIK